MRQSPNKITNNIEYFHHIMNLNFQKNTNFATKLGLYKWVR